MLHPHFIKFEKPKNNLYLTFSAVVDSNSRKILLDIQDKVEEIIKKSDGLKCVDLEKTKEGLYKKISGQNRFIYRYPGDTLHFSILNFATYNIVTLCNFEGARKIIKNTANFRELIKEIKKFKNSFTKKVEKVRIERIYLPGGIEGSLALSVLPVTINGKLFEDLNSIKKNTEREMNKKLISHDLKIKAYPEGDCKYFALNIFRFIDKDDTLLDQGGSFYQEIEKINQEIKKETIKIKPCIVISDPYLANNEPTKIDC